MSTPNPFELEILRLAPRLGLGVLAITASTNHDEAALRLAQSGLPPDMIDRAVRRAHAWPTLTPLEQAILNLPMNEPMPLPEQFARIPAELRPRAPGNYARVEYEIAMVGLYERGLVGMVGLDPQTLAALTAWATVPEADRQAIYREFVAAGQDHPWLREEERA